MPKPVKKVGNYVIFLNEKIGFGTFSQVFRGVECQPNSVLTGQNITKRHVAVKIMLKQTIQKDSYKKKAFQDELEIMRRVKSTNIIQLYHFVETKNSYYLFLELADQNLRSYLNNNKRLDEVTAWRFLGQIVNGFGELAKHGIVHRDLKPENILLKGDSVKIADFGLAKISEKQSFLISAVGTPRYMSPQVLL